MHRIELKKIECCHGCPYLRGVPFWCFYYDKKLDMDTVAGGEKPGWCTIVQVEKMAYFEEDIPGYGEKE